MAKGKFVTIKVTPPLGAVNARCRQWQYSIVPQVIETNYSQLLNTTMRIMKQEAPRSSGQLKDSIRIKEKTTSGGSRDKRYHGRVGPTARYAHFVERGTGPSPGRFIMAIEKRIKDGTHPGTPRNAFVERTMIRVEAIAEQKANKIGSDARSRFRLI